jgi:predicted DCC family thiol-disulfide oxidoreductase YuxK
MNKDIILFDGVCNLCNCFVQFTIERDKQSKFKFASLQSKSGQYLLAQNKLPVENFTSFVYLKGGQCLLKSSAILHFLKELGGVWKVFFILILIPKPIRDFVYSFIANSRYKIFGRRESCFLPTPELKNRFLE